MSGRATKCECEPVLISGYKSLIYASGAVSDSDSKSVSGVAIRKGLQS